MHLYPLWPPKADGVAGPCLSVALGAHQGPHAKTFQQQRRCRPLRNERDDMQVECTALHHLFGADRRHRLHTNARDAAKTTNNTNDTNDTNNTNTNNTNNNNNNMGAFFHHTSTAGMPAPPPCRPVITTKEMALQVECTGLHHLFGPAPVTTSAAKSASAASPGPSRPALCQLTAAAGVLHRDCSCRRDLLGLVGREHRTLPRDLVRPRDAAMGAGARVIR